jgi:hypothetical protein
VPQRRDRATALKLDAIEQTDMATQSANAVGGVVRGMGDGYGAVVRTVLAYRPSRAECFLRRY